MFKFKENVIYFVIGVTFSEICTFVLDNIFKVAVFVVKFLKGTLPLEDSVS